MCAFPLPRPLSRGAPSAHAPRGPGPGRAFHRHRLASPSGLFCEAGTPSTPIFVWRVAKPGEVMSLMRGHIARTGQTGIARGTAWPRISIPRHPPPRRDA